MPATAPGGIPPFFCGVPVGLLAFVAEEAGMVLEDDSGDVVGIRDVLAALIGEEEDVLDEEVAVVDTLPALNCKHVSFTVMGAPLTMQGS